MSPARGWFVAVAAVLAFAAPVSAQQEALADADPSPVTVTSEVAPEAGAAPLFGPTKAGVALFAPVAQLDLDSPLTPPALRQRASEDVALMLVGGAGLVVGAIIGGDAGTIVMVGGAVIGLIGLYRYLR